MSNPYDLLAGSFSFSKIAIMFATQYKRQTMQQAPTLVDKAQPSASSSAKPQNNPRPFVSLAKKQNTFVMKLGSVAAGAVIVSLLVTTGYMYYKDREARATVPKTPPIDAIVLPLKRIDPVAPPVLVSEAAAAVPSAAASAAVAPLMSASEASTQQSRADQATPEVDQVAFLDLTKRVDQMQSKVDDATKAIADLQKQVNAQAVRLRAATSDKKEDAIEMKVTKISQYSVDVMVGLKKYTVASGGQLPGGAIYIGFDAAKSMMYTDRGDFRIN